MQKFVKFQNRQKWVLELEIGKYPYVFNSVIPVVTMNEKNSEGVQDAFTNGGSRVTQIIDQLGYHWLHDLVHDVSIQSR